MTKDQDDIYCRRQAMQLAVQLPDDPERALRVIEHLRSLVPFMAGEIAPRPSAPVLRVVKEV